MAKVGRNDPCPCGSGLKYKKCCGNSNIISFNPLQMNQELMKLQDELIRFSNAHYEHELVKLNLNHLEDNLVEASDDETVKNYIGLLFPWIILHEVVANQQTIFDLFWQQKSSQIHSRKVKEVFASWQDAISSVFEIISVDDLTEEKMTVLDLATKQTYEVVYEDIDENSLGDFIVGTLAPLIQSHTFMYATIQFPKEEIDFIYHLVDGFDLHTHTMTELFPSCLGDIFEPYEADLEWPKQIYEEVAEEFVYHMKEKNINDDIIYSGILFWNHYCVEHNPTVMKTSTYAAALDYFMSLAVLADDRVTQADLAKEYKVSTTSISTHYQKFVDEIKKTSTNE